MFGKIAVNTIYQLLNKFISAAVGFVIVYLLIRNYSVGDYGEYVKIVSFVTAFWIFGDFGLNIIIQHKYALAKDVQEIKYYFNKLLNLRIFLAFILISIIGLTLFFLPENYSEVSKLGILLYGITVFSQNIYLSFISLFQYTLNYRNFFLSSLTQNLINIIWVAITIFFNFPVLYLVAGLALSSLSLIFISLLLTDKKYLTFAIYKDFNSIWKLLIIAAPMGLILIFNLLYFHLDSFLLATIRGNFEVAIYGLAYKFFETVLAVPAFYGNSIYPMLLKKEHDKKVLFYKSLGLLILLATLATVFIYALSPLLINLISGTNDYAGSVSALRILSLSFPVYFITSLLMWYFVSLKKYRQLLFIYGSSLLVNLIGNLIFIPQYGYIASAAITGLSEVYILIMYIFMAVKVKPE